MSANAVEAARSVKEKCEDLLKMASCRTQGKWIARRVFADWGFAHVDEDLTQIVNDWNGVIDIRNPNDTDTNE